MALKAVAYEVIRVQCNHCKTVLESDSVKDFKEFNTLPPSIGFMCVECGNLARIHYADIPKRIQAHLLSKVSREFVVDNARGCNHPSYTNLSPFLDDDKIFNNALREI